MDDYFYYASQDIDSQKCPDNQGCRYNNGFSDICCANVSITYNNSSHNNMTLLRCFNSQIFNKTYAISNFLVKLQCNIKLNYAHYL